MINWTISFWPDAVLLRSAETSKIAVPIANNFYRVNAEVVYISQDPTQAACILDFGIRAISESGGLLGIPLPQGCREGDHVTGKIRLELPLCTDVHPYDISHQWRVNRISANLANFSYYPGDLGELDYQDIAGTDSIKAGSYVLHCSKLNSVI